MTKVGRLFEEEKQEAIEKTRKEEREKTKQEERVKLAKSLLDILSPEIIAEKTGLDIDEVKKLKD